MIKYLDRPTGIPIFDDIVTKINEIISDVNNIHEEHNLTIIEKKHIIEDQLIYLTSTIDGRIHKSKEVTVNNFEQFSYDDFKDEIRSEDDYNICMSILRKLSKELK